MSQSRNRYVNSNVNGALSSQKAGSGYQQPYSQAPRYGSGLVSLGAPKQVGGVCGPVREPRTEGHGAGSLHQCRQLRAKGSFVRMRCVPCSSYVPAAGEGADLKCLSAEGKVASVKLGVEARSAQACEFTVAEEGATPCNGRSQSPRLLLPSCRPGAWPDSWGAATGERRQRSQHPDCPVRRRN